MKIIFHSKEVEIPYLKSAQEILKHFNLISNTVVFLRNGEILDPALKIRILPEDQIEIIKVISGG